MHFDQLIKRWEIRFLLNKTRFGRFNGTWPCHRQGSYFQPIKFGARAILLTKCPWKTLKIGKMGLSNNVFYGKSQINYVIKYIPCPFWVLKRECLLRCSMIFLAYYILNPACLSTLHNCTTPLRNALYLWSIKHQSTKWHTFINMWYLQAT